jgi:hypothetical protein
MPGGFVRYTTNQLEPISGRQDLTIDATAGGLALTVPATAVAGFGVVETAAIRFTLEGTAPTATVGTNLAAGDIIIFESRAELLGFKAIRMTGTSATLHVEYFGVDA